MDLLILAVDRDDDLGRKTSFRGPIVGREAIIEAATAFMLADPEDSDANALFAAVQEYDRVARSPESYGATNVHVATVTGHVRVGAKSDAILAKQVDEVLERTGAEAVILVADGAEDEHILPILSSRAKINGTRRVIVKQAQNLEGFVYLVARLMNDEKMQKRFFIPLAFLLIVAAASFYFRRPELFVSGALLLAAGVILVQVFAWQDALGNLFSEFGREMKAGKLFLYASLISFMLLVGGGAWTLESMRDLGPLDTTTYAVLFADAMLWWVAGALLFALAGRVLDHWIRRGGLPRRATMGILFLLSGAILAEALVDVAVAWTQQTSWTTLYLELLTSLFFAGFLFFSGLIGLRYFHTIAQEESTAGATRRGP